MDYSLNGLRKSPGENVLAFSDLRAVRGPPPAAWTTEGQDALVANALESHAAAHEERLPPGPAQPWPWGLVRQFKTLD